MFVGVTLECLIADGFPHGSLFWDHHSCSVRNTSITKSQRVRARIPSMRKPASREMISDSVELCGTDVCFLHVQLVGTHV